jgi:hypothetical protein
MPMNIIVQWLNFLELDYTDEGGYCCPEPPLLSECSGVYVFARQFGTSVNPIYVGQAQNIRVRIRQQFRNHPLMRGIENAGNGRRLLLQGEVITRRGQQLVHVLNVVERGLIEHFLGEGYTLLNVRGANVPSDTVTFQGNQLSRGLCSCITLPRRR